MDMNTTFLIGIVLIIISAIFITAPWEKKAPLDLISREEKDDLVDSTHHCPVVAEQVNEAVTKRRSSRKKETSIDACALSNQEQVVPAKKTRRVKQI